MAIRVRWSSSILLTLTGYTENWCLDRVIETQAFLVTLIRTFDISPADHQPQIRRTRSVLMAPIVLGEERKGPQLPLKIAAIAIRK